LCDILAVIAEYMCV